MKRADFRAFWIGVVYNFFSKIFLSSKNPILTKTLIKKIMNHSNFKCSKIRVFQNFSTKTILTITVWLKKTHVQGFCKIWNNKHFLAIFVNLWKCLESAVFRPFWKSITNGFIWGGSGLFLLHILSVYYFLVYKNILKTRDTSFYVIRKFLKLSTSVILLLKLL